MLVSVGFSPFQYLVVLKMGGKANESGRREQLLISKFEIDARPR